MILGMLFMVYLYSTFPGYVGWYYPPPQTKIRGVGDDNVYYLLKTWKYLSGHTL